VPGPDIHGAAHGVRDKELVVALGAHEARPRGLAEGEAIADARHRGVHDLGQVLRGLDEMGLAHDDVRAILPGERHDADLRFHVYSSRIRSRESSAAAHGIWMPQFSSTWGANSPMIPTLRPLTRSPLPGLG
jgi:hypothetical protein